MTQMTSNGLYALGVQGAGIVQAPATIAGMQIDETGVSVALQALGCGVIALSGTTLNRPVPTASPAYFIDRTLGKLILWNGANWFDPLTGLVV